MERYCRVVLGLLSRSTELSAAGGSQDDLYFYLRTLEQTRAMLVGGTILLLIVPNVVIAFRYINSSPVAAALGSSSE
jgi:hypothetical protein